MEAGSNPGHAHRMEAGSNPGRAHRMEAGSNPGRAHLIPCTAMRQHLSHSPAGEQPVPRCSWSEGSVHCGAGHSLQLYVHSLGSGLG